MDNANNLEDAGLQQRYLDLMKGCLTHSLWVEYTRRIDPSMMPYSAKRLLVESITGVLGKFRLGLVRLFDLYPPVREYDEDWPEYASNEDAVSLIEGDGLMEGGQDAGSFSSVKDRRKPGGNGHRWRREETRPGAWIAVGTVTGGPDAGLEKAAKLFNIKMKEIAGGIAFVTHDWRLGRVEGREAIEAWSYSIRNGQSSAMQ